MRSCGCIAKFSELECSKEELDAWNSYNGSFDEVEPDDIDVKNQWAVYGTHRLVGHGEVSNPEKCGVWMGNFGCLRVDLHNLVNLEGMNYQGKMYGRNVRHSCNNPNCPVCYMYGWAVREAGNVKSRLAEGSKRFGKVEHIVLSIPDSDYGLSVEAVRKKAVDKVMTPLGIVGGCIIFHGFRYRSADKVRGTAVNMGWYWSPHFHVLGFIAGGYGKCRSCPNKALNGNIHSRDECMACDGFEMKVRKHYDKLGGRSGSGYIVKVLDERRTVGGTAWYQLNHCSVDVSKKRYHTTTWFGVCSYRAMKLPKRKVEHGLCPICGMDLVRIKFVGGVLTEGDKMMSEFFDDMCDERGVARWVECHGHRHSGA